MKTVELWGVSCDASGGADDNASILIPYDSVIRWARVTAYASLAPAQTGAITFSWELGFLPTSVINTGEGILNRLIAAGQFCGYRHNATDSLPVNMLNEFFPGLNVKTIKNQPLYLYVNGGTTFATYATLTCGVERL